ncbi:type II toxin-antitoxin system MqsA family antitoxin [Methylomonas sp. WSC-6]|uniref:Type II toxin-antitoxin system MqsA family antitoxin n=2 Tax=Methylomonas rivi TaxID=2952226 RepID=A0ABT1U4N0_9GAMM|nr:type II toxin-antitoxin system MqsA family antitoxin [Methylomonas sp. WSC-6]MCQ8128389.1 type II toxin-antitoxin system MqsA family antitoxin [Methylomonas sp. WSC-6]
MNIEKIAKAIEADAGQSLEDLRQSLAEMQASEGRTTTKGQILLRTVRTKTGLSQQTLAQYIQTPVATLRDWEQGRFPVPGGVLCLLTLINNHPELLAELQAA